MIIKNNKIYTNYDGTEDSSRTQVDIEDLISIPGNCLAQNIALHGDVTTTDITVPFYAYSESDLTIQEIGNNFYTKSVYPTGDRINCKKLSLKNIDVNKCKSVTPIYSTEEPQRFVKMSSSLFDGNLFYFIDCELIFEGSDRNRYYLFQPNWGCIPITTSKSTNSYGKAPVLLSTWSSTELSFATVINSGGWAIGSFLHFRIYPFFFTLT